MKTEQNRNDSNGSGNSGHGMEMITVQRDNEQRRYVDQRTYHYHNYVNCSCCNVPFGSNDSTTSQKLVLLIANSSWVLGIILIIALICFAVDFLCSAINASIEKLGNEWVNAIKAINWTSIIEASQRYKNNGTGATAKHNRTYSMKFSQENHISNPTNSDSVPQ